MIMSLPSSFMAEGNLFWKETIFLANSSFCSIIEMQLSHIENFAHIEKTEIFETLVSTKISM